MVFGLLCLFALLCGAVEAILYERRGAESFTWNEHALYTVQRAVVYAAVLVGVFFVPRYEASTESVAAWLCFPLFHDESYNFWRVLLTQQRLQAAWAVYTFGYQSATTTARFDFNNRQRLTLAALGLVVLTSPWWWGVVNNLI